MKLQNTLADGSGTSYQPSGSIVMTGNITLYAQWSSGSLRDGTPDSSPRSGNNICAIETVKYEYGNDTWQDQLTQMKTYTVSAAGVQTLTNTQNLSYDEMGNATSYLGKTLSWEGKRLTNSTSSGQNIAYAYDENGLRTQKTVNGVTTNYYYNGSVLIGMTAGSIYQRFSYDSSGRLVAVDYSTNSGTNYTTYYYQRNAQGDVINLLDSADTTIVQYAYDTWGKLVGADFALSLPH
ncbi:MAG: hypothetical protein PHT58_00785 [Eubacteriales bacterium]|nr:hypothetical protein [Eubacteriales bacterium]